MTTTTDTPNELTTLDRCDRCGAQAYVRTAPHGLLWCCHHFRQHEPKLLAGGATVTADDRTHLQRQEGKP